MSEWDEIMEKCETTNGSGHPCFSLACLDDSDLVRLYDICNDLGDLVNADGIENPESDILSRTIYNAAIWSGEIQSCRDALIDDSDGEDYASRVWELYEDAVEFLRKRCDSDE